MTKKIPAGWPLPHPLAMNRVPWDLVRGLLLSALAASSEDSPDDMAYELERWRAAIPGTDFPGMTLVQWVPTLLEQRVLVLQAFALGYPYEGAAVLETVNEASKEHGPAVVTFARARGTFDPTLGAAPPRGQVVVRFTWPAAKLSQAYERCPRIPCKAAGVGPGANRQLIPDAWRLVPPAMLQVEEPRSEWDAMLLSRYAPGFMDDGVSIDTTDPTDEAERQLKQDGLTMLGYPPIPTPETQSQLDALYRTREAASLWAMPHLPPVGATEPETKVEAGPPQEPPPSPSVAEVVSTASVECRQCLAHFTCPEFRVAEEVRMGCSTCGADVGAVNVQVLGEDTNPRPAREWLPPIQPAPGVEPDTGGPMPYSALDTGEKPKRKRRKAHGAPDAHAHDKEETT